MKEKQLPKILQWWVSPKLPKHFIKAGGRAILRDIGLQEVRLLYLNLIFDAAKDKYKKSCTGFERGIS